MKKLLTIMVVALVLLVSGCGNEGMFAQESDNYLSPNFYENYSDSEPNPGYSADSSTYTSSSHSDYFSYSDQNSRANFSSNSSEFELDKDNYFNEEIVSNDSPYSYTESKDISEQYVAEEKPQYNNYEDEDSFTSIIQEYTEDDATSYETENSWRPAYWTEDIANSVLMSSVYLPLSPTLDPDVLNIEKAVDLLTVVVEPGKSFDFWEILGSEEKFEFGYDNIVDEEITGCGLNYLASLIREAAIQSNICTVTECSFSNSSNLDISGIIVLDGTSENDLIIKNTFSNEIVFRAFHSSEYLYAQVLYK